MYRDHAPLIAEHGNSSAQGLQDIVTFVLSTIQTPISRASTVAEDIRELGVESRYLNESKRNAVSYIAKRKRGLHTKLQAARSAQQAIEHIIETPGLGVVKAAFTAQLLGFDVGCIDRHNIILYNVAPAVLRVPPKLTRETKRAKIDAYVSLCLDIGGTEHMWDAWCQHVAGTKWNKRLPTAELVSLEHVRGCNL
jgi:hypothetical protein